MVQEARWPAGSGLVPTQGLDRTRGQQAGLPWGCACSKVSAHQRPQRANRHWVCIRALLCLSWSKEQRGVVQKQGESEPQPGNALPWQMGRGTRTLLLRAILKCWAVYPWDPVRGCGNGGRVGVEGREGSSQKGMPCGRPWDWSCHVGAQEKAPLERPPPRQPVPCSVLVGLWKWVAEQRALISSCQHDVGKNTPWKTRLRPGTKIATVPPPGSRYQQREFVQVERPILFTVRTLARGRESFTHRAGREGPSGHSWNAAPRTDVAWGVSQAAPQPVAGRQGTAWQLS